MRVSPESAQRPNERFPAPHPLDRQPLRQGIAGRVQRRVSTLLAARRRPRRPRTPVDGDAVAIAPSLAPFINQATVVLTTYRRNGTPVGTPVHIAVAADRAFVRTYDVAGKVGRIRRTPEVTIAPSTVRGTVTGPTLRARARLLTGEDAHRAGRALARKYPFLHGVLVPLVHRLRRYQTVHIELLPDDGSRA